MQNYFADLLAFFGISGTPQTFAELIPWLFAVLVAIGIVLACFRLVSDCIFNGGCFGRVVCRGRVVIGIGRERAEHTQAESNEEVRQFVHMYHPKIM